MTKKATQPAKLIDNRRARFDYELQEQFQVGVVLNGPEVRAARDGRVHLVGAYVTVKNNELWLTNSSFSLPSTTGSTEKTVDTNPRKLLAKKSEIARIIAAREQGLTVVPLNMTTGGRYIKLHIATAKGKKLYDKRETIKKRDTERELRRNFKPQSTGK
ncbi:MAG TPA: SsrA-binding protein SmpB [Candidatus Acidoferrum sp.]|nr:SsrA-binding protein SmpB [Candidatus Acidoferrum sp.]